MLIVMQHGATADQVERVVETIQDMGYQARPMPGAQRTAIGLVGNDGRVDESRLAALLPDLEAALAPFGQRPHWGKMSSLDGDAIENLYPALPKFRDLVHRSDPDGVFRGPFLERIIRL